MNSLVTYVAMLIGLTTSVKTIVEASRRGGKPFYFQDRAGQMMEVRRTGLPMAKRQCECFCLVAGDEGSIHCCIECHVTDSVCFPGSAHVTRENGDVIKIGDLNIGDEIQTASAEGEIHTTRVLGFLTFDPEVIGRYYKLTVDGGEALTLSRSHLVFASNTNTTQNALPIFAAEVKVGQYLLVKKGKQMVPKRVLASEIQILQGAYVPLTSDGTLLVDGVKASSYAAFPHHLSHAFLAPLRWFPSLTSLFTPTKGDHPYVTAMKAFGDIIAPSARFSAAGNTIVAQNGSTSAGSDTTLLRNTMDSLWT